MFLFHKKHHYPKSFTVLNITIKRNFHSDCQVVLGDRNEMSETGNF